MTLAPHHGGSRYTGGPSSVPVSVTFHFSALPASPSHQEQPGSSTRIQRTVKRTLAGGLPNPGPGDDPDVVASTRRRKEQDPNWSREDILALVEAKREEYIDEMEVTDVRDLMASELTKWGCIAEKVIAATGGEIIREAPACKHKWQSTISEYKRIVDFHYTTGTNSEEYRFRRSRS